MGGLDYGDLTMELKITAERLREAAKQDASVAGVLKALFPEAFVAAEELFPQTFAVQDTKYPGALILWRRDAQASMYKNRAVALDTDDFTWELKMDDTPGMVESGRRLLLIPTRKL